MKEFESIFKKKIKLIEELPSFSLQGQLLLACCKLKQGKYEECFALIEPIVRQRQNTYNTKLTIYYLKLIANLELKQYGKVKTTNEKIKQLFEENKEVDFPRLAPITDIINAIASGINYREVIKLQKENIELLQFNHRIYHWDPLGWELIRFDDWLFKQSDH